METTIMYQNQSLNAKLNISYYVNISLWLKYILSLPLKNTSNMTWAKAKEKSQAQIQNKIFCEIDPWFPWKRHWIHKTIG